MNKSSGFTLIEMLMAVTVFSMIAAVSYAVLGVAGDGFIRLQEFRDAQEQTGWTQRQLRNDCDMMTSSFYRGSRPLLLRNDTRGDTYFDELTLLVREPGRAGITQVYYHLDEETEMLIRESRLLWAAEQVEPQRMELSKAQSFQVEVMLPSGEWVRRLNTSGPFIWPHALRIHLRDTEGRESMWLLPTVAALL